MSKTILVIVWLTFVLVGETFGSITVPVSDKNWYFTELNWLMSPDHSYAQTQYPGAYFKIGFTGTSISLLLNQSNTPTGHYANVKYIIDDLPAVTFGLPAPTNRVVLATGLKSGNHNLVVYLQNSYQLVDRWYVPTCVFRVTGLEIDANSVTYPPVLRPKRMLVFWDSIGEGVRVLGVNGDDLVVNEATESWSFGLAAALDAELSMAAFGAQGWSIQGFGNVAPFFTPGNDSYSAWNKLDSKHPRVFNKSQIDYVFCGHGTNDLLNLRPDQLITDSALGWLIAIRAVIPTRTHIFLTVPFGGFFKNAITSAYKIYQQKYINDVNTHFIDLGTAGSYGLTWFAFNGTAVSGDGLHPLAWRDGQLSAMLAVQAVLQLKN